VAWSRESRQSRGYGAEWEKVRALVYKRDSGLCQACLREDRVTAGKEVDHIVPKAEAARRGWTQEQIDAESNLELKCHSCHEKKTAKDNGRAYRPKVRFGPDGWPIDEGG
jgi:5-methylcytosine-specific restriction protein A